MRKLLGVVAGLVLGVIIGAAAVYFLLVRAPAPSRPPGEAVTPPPAAGPPEGTAVMTLDEKFFNALLGTLLRDVGSPTFQLSRAPGAAETPGGLASYLEAQAGGCQSQVSILPERNGARTGVRLQGGRITAPLVFSGTFRLPLIGTCVPFSGTTEAQIDLFFNQGEQALYGMVRVDQVALDNVSDQYSPDVTRLVQAGLNRGVNPLTIMRGSPLTITLPVAAAGGTVQGRAREVHTEAQEGSLKIFITYDFTGSHELPPPAPAT